MVHCDQAGPRDHRSSDSYHNNTIFSMAVKKDCDLNSAEGGGMRPAVSKNWLVPGQRWALTN